MRIVQSLWSKPLLNQSKLIEKKFGGWRQLEYFYMSWALSCLTIYRYYENIELVTDRLGYDLLIKKLKLPYSNVKIVLNKLDYYPDKLWAIGKIFAYQIQKDPFIHMDGDVFIWEKFHPKIENAALIAQQIDVDKGHYKYGLDETRKKKFFLPKTILNNLLINNKIYAHNAGIIGGNNVDFFKSFCKEAFNMIDINSTKYFLSFSETSYALLYEQLLFSCMARQTKQKISCLINHDFVSAENEKIDISNFQNKYGNSLKYVHLVGQTKNDLTFCYELRNQLQVEFPQYLELIDKLIYDDK